MQYLRAISFLLIPLICSPAYSASKECRALLSQYSDGTILHRGRGGWEKISKLSALSQGRARRAELMFLAKNRPSEEKTGVLIVKTGMNGSNYGSRKFVILSRTKAKGDETRCKFSSQPAMPRTPVDHDSYDKFHDVGYDDGIEDLDTINRFHIDYVNRKGQCDRTDSIYPDQYLRRAKTNRSQFSFDKGIVDGGVGFFDQLAELFVSKSRANSKELTNRNVRMYQYTLDRTGSACLTFQVKAGDHAVVRVVDLEGRTNGNRTPEQRY